MKITWKDGVTTIAAAGAVAVGAAHFHNYTWPLVSSTRWTIGIIAALMAIGFCSSYFLNHAKPNGWYFVASFLGILATVITIGGLETADSSYAVLLMLTTVIFWLSAMLRHLVIHVSMTASRALSTDEQNA